MTTTIRRLARGDEQRAREMFALMAAAFGEPAEALSDEDVDELLTSAAFWAVAAFDEGRVIGGITAHTIAMTRSPRAELFVYDLAVDEAFRRRGVGTQLLATLRALAAEAGLGEVFVLADADDLDAVAFYGSQGGRGSAVTLFGWDGPLTRPVEREVR